MLENIEEYTEELDELLFITMHKFAVEHNLIINQDSNFENGRITFTIKGKAEE